MVCGLGTPCFRTWTIRDKTTILILGTVASSILDGTLVHRSGAQCWLHAFKADSRESMAGASWGMGEWIPTVVPIRPL